MKESPVKDQVEGSEIDREVLGAIQTSSSGSSSVGNEGKIGIERAFDVIRHHTVHTKNYVMTALQLIEEFGDSQDKAKLAELLKQKSNDLTPASSGKKRVAKKR